MNRRFENQQQPDRYSQQEWSDDDYRGGNRYRVNQPYASGEDLQEFPRGGRFQSNARQGYGDTQFNQQGGYGSGYSQTGTPYGNPNQPQRGFSGRGPKGYTRSDDRLKEDISERLTEDYAIDASDISVEVRNGTVTLTGTVDERWMKHHAEDLVDRCSGVQDIENRLTVSRSRTGTSSQSQPSTGSSTTTSGSTRKQ